MTIRKKSKKVLSLLLGGMLVFATPLQTLAEDEPKTENPTEEISVEEAPEEVAVQETVSQPETPVETAAPQPVVEAPVQPATPEATVLSATPEPVFATPAPTPVATPEAQKTAEPVSTPEVKATPETAEQENKETVEKPAETATPTPAATEETKKEEKVKEEEKDAYQGTQKLNAKTSDGVKVNVSFEAGTFGEEKLPELKVKDLSEKKAIASAKKALPGEDIEEAKSVDISFYVNGKEVQPVDGQKVSVKIDLPESLNPDGVKGKPALIHEHGGKAEVVSSAKVSASEASFQTDSFSSFTITWTHRNQRNNQPAKLTVYYVDENRVEISKTKPQDITFENDDYDVSFAGPGSGSAYTQNGNDYYRYYRTYVLNDNNQEIEITNVHFECQRQGYGYYTYTVSYQNNGRNVLTDTTYSENGPRNRNVYVEYQRIYSGDHVASVYFLLTPTSDAKSNAVNQWNSNEIAVGLGNATVNLEGATFSPDPNVTSKADKNVVRGQGGNGDLSQYIKNWPGGSTGATWTITENNTPGGQWNAITESVAEKYQAQLQAHHESTTNISASDIESITVTPYKISVNNGNIPIEGSGNTEVIHIDCTISVVSSKAYHYAFMVDFPEGSSFSDGSVKEGDKAIRASSSGRVPEAILESDKPATAKAPATVTDNKGNTYTFDGWYKDSGYRNRAEFAYQPTTDEIKTSNGTIRFYGRYVQSKKKINVTKTWSDNDNQDGLRPTEVTVKLLANGEETGKTITLTAGGNWSGTFEDLPIRNDDGNQITYTVAETPVEGYASSVSDNGNSGFTITNTHTPQTVTISGRKIWDDNQNSDGKRPSSVTVRLHKNGKEINNVTVSGNNDTDTWNYSFTGLPQYENGALNSYTVTEDAVPDYSTSINEQNYDITNSYTPTKTSVSVSKVWNDNNNQDGIRPESVTVKLLKDGIDTGKTAILSNVNNWTAEFSNLDEYQNSGTKIVYTVAETAVDGYTSEVTGDATTGFIITNTHELDKRDITVNKTWDDKNNQDGKRPAAVTVRLQANGIEMESQQLTAANNWSYTFKDLPKNSDGKEITYSVTEDAVENYSTKINGFNITNSYTPEQTSVSVIKEWDDNHNQDGIRPDQVVAVLYANGDKTGQAVTLSDQNNWGDTFKNLDVYKDGQKIAYTVQEETVPAGYQSDVSGDATEGFRITNAHQPETVDIQGTKTWDDNGNNDKNRPESVTIRLLADGEPLEDHVQTVSGNSTANTWNFAFNGLPKYKDGNRIRYTVTEDQVRDYTSAVNDVDYNITNTYTPDKTSVTVTKSWADNQNQDGKRPGGVTVELLENGNSSGKTMILTAEGGWTGTFDNLPVRKDNKTVVYSVQEKAVAGYESVTTGDAVTGFLIENVHTPETINIPVTKTWVDGKNKDNNRPESITVRLYANGKALEDHIKTVTGDLKADTWTDEFKNLPKYADGEEISYTVSEDAVDNYSAEINDEDYNITNRHAKNQTSVTVTKHWEDKNNQDGIRPESVTVQLLEDGEVKDHILTLTEDNGWSGTFEDLPIVKNGNRVEYTVQETSVNGYTTHYSGSATEGFVVTNIHDPETTNIEGTKTWNDSNNQDNKRPESITVRLHADGEIVQSKEVTEGDQWKYAFTNLPKYEKGREIEYTISEDEVDNYSVSYSGYHLTNSYTPEQTSVTVSKAWEDKNNQDGRRPKDVTVRLYADDNDTGKTVKLNEGNGWESAFDELDLNQNGQRIHYTVKEDSVSGYESSVSGDAKTGYVITNVHKPETISVQGTKTWKGGNDTTRPESITVRLHADGEIVQSKEVTADDQWKYTFTDLPRYAEGKEITYTVSEDEVDNYSTQINGYNLINTYTPGKTSLTVSKAWEDKDNQDGIRPETVSVRLYANGEKTDRAIPVTESGKWEATFQDLDLKDKDGERITYTVKEENVPEGYESVVSGDAKTGFVITNVHAPETIKISGSKIWKDLNNQNGRRPSVITIRLFAGDDEIRFIQVSGDQKADAWYYEFTDVARYKNGKEISYTVTEDAVDEYSTEVNGFDIINTFTPGATVPSDPENTPPADRKEDQKQEENVPVKTEDRKNKDQTDKTSENRNQVIPDTRDQFDQKKYAILLLAGLIVIIGTMFRMIGDHKES